MDNKKGVKMRTLMEQGIDIKKIDYVIFERPNQFCTISFKNGGVMSKTLNHLNKKQIQKLEKFEKTDFDLEFEEVMA
jgi:hypothetical protein